MRIFKKEKYNKNAIESMTEMIDVLAEENAALMRKCLKLHKEKIELECRLYELECTKKTHRQ
jgi:hypothetical protein